MPLKELERLQAVNRFLKLEISKEKELQEIVAFAADICGVPTALITLIAGDRQHILFKVGFDKDSTSRQEAFCSHAIEQDSLMIVPDALLDGRFINNPLVTGEPKIRFYAGAPLTTADGYNLGSLCVIDRTPRKLSNQQKKMLQMLSRQVIQLLEFDSSLNILKEQYIQTRNIAMELRSFFESSVDCHMLLGRHFELLAFNRSTERIIHRERGLELVRGNKMDKYLHPAIRQGFYLNYLSALGGTAVFEQRKLDYGDHFIHWVIKYEPAFTESGDIMGVSVNAADATLRVNHEEKVALQNTSLNKIAFIQSHELRKPVASIIGLLDIIRNNPRISNIEEFKLMETAILELDEKIRLVVNYTSSP